MSKDEHPTPKSVSSKMNFKLKSENNSYDFTLLNKENELTFKFEDLKEFPVKLYELKIDFEKLRETDENIGMFNRVDRFIKTIKTSIQNEKYSVSFNEEENAVIFEIKNEIFENGGAKIKIPEEVQDINSQVESLTKTVAELRKEIQNMKIKQLEKDEAAVKSFQESSFLKDEEKKMISKWIHPDKVIRFVMLYSTDKDNDSSSYFHYYCDGIVPTVTVVLDTQGRRFGGYCTQNWTQHSDGSAYARAQESFLFNLTNQKKYELNNQFDTNAIYKGNSYGPTFGGGHDLYIYSNSKSNNNYCNKSTYNTGDNNLLGENGQTYFTVSSYEVYKVIFE